MRSGSPRPATAASRASRSGCANGSDWPAHSSAPHVLPLVGEEEFGLVSRAAILSFVVAFGVAKAFTNLGAGVLADRVGRKRLLVTGWLVARASCAICASWSACFPECQRRPLISYTAPCDRWRRYVEARRDGELGHIIPEDGLDPDAAHGSDGNARVSSDVRQSPGPLHSNGKCLLERPAQSNENPNASA
jgi:hypothetical protein